MITRWYVGGVRRFESELNLIKVLKTLRNLKIGMDATIRSDQSPAILHPKNVIEVDSDDLLMNSLG